MPLIALQLLCPNRTMNAACMSRNVIIANATTTESELSDRGVSNGDPTAQLTRHGSLRFPLIRQDYVMWLAEEREQLLVEALSAGFVWAPECKST